MAAAALHLEHQIGSPYRARHGDWRANQNRILRLAAQQIERVGDAHNLIERAAVHGVATVARLLEHVRGLGGENPFRKRDDGGARRHELPDGTIGKREHARDNRHFVGRGQGVSVGARQQRGERGARRSLAVWNERRQERAEAIQERHRPSDERLRPPPAEDARDEIRGADEERHPDGDREDAEECGRRCREQCRNGAGGKQHADRGEHVGRRQRPPGVLQHAHGSGGAAQLVCHPARQLVLADPGRRDTDGGRHTGENESHQQHRQGDVHRFSNETCVTRRWSTRSTTTRKPSSVSSSPGRGTRPSTE